MRKIFYTLGFYLVFASAAFASTIAAEKIPDAKIVGEGRMTYLFFDVYDSTLYAPGGKFTETAPYALTLRYLRSLDGQAIAERSVEEMRKQGFNDETKLNAWLARMREIFPDVKNGTELTAVFTPGKTTDFYHDGKLIATIKDPQFTKQFSNIWLGEKTSEPELRGKLLGNI